VMGTDVTKSPKKRKVVERRGNLEEGGIYSVVRKKTKPNTRPIMGTFWRVKGLEVVRHV